MTIVATDQTFTSEVLESSVPVLVNFGAPWCGLCRMIDPQLSKLKAEFGSEVKFVRVNADDNIKLANTYQLKDLPTLLVFRDGAMVQRFDRFRNGDDVRRAFGDLRIVLAHQLPSLSR